MAITINTMNTISPAAEVKIHVVGPESEKEVQKKYIEEILDEAAGVFKK
jgi:hypothetical protein